MPSYRFSESDHIHLLDGKPLYGTTTVLSILGKGGLTWWASQMAVKEFGWLDPKKNNKDDIIKSAATMHAKICGMPFPDYLELLTTAYRAHDTRKKDRAEEGIDIHSLCEKFINFVMARPGYKTDFDIRPISKWVDWCEKNVKRFLFSEIHCYSERLWTGGICDFAFEDMKGDWILADIKSREKVYFSDIIQMGAYHLQLEENGGYTADGKKIFTLDKPFKAHAVFPITEKFVEPVFNPNTIRAKKSFESAVTLYKNKEEFER